MAPLVAPAPDYLGYSYAALIALGGLMGGLKRGSKISLVAGCVFSLFAAYGASRVSQNPTDTIPSLDELNTGNILLLVSYYYLATASTLLVMMGYRFFQSGKFMPAGLGESDLTNL
uniref:Uncharacterized protein n=1 Tax=Kwoniella dejecticola CBS 10117 TaxID=1296121 RepID=A0A1A6ACF8_9TREE|nr:uncharacterized protein I303_01935 [Kwoniella dejecticola CBS 10117]OBR87723.1 hypothetical protein I303_01935 [Kwoniella dejecticola CBS 10117]